MLRFTSYSQLVEARKNAHLDVQKKSNALEILSKYKNDPTIHVSYTKLNKIGINPKSNFPDTPLAVFTYPLKEIWHDIETEGVGNVQFAATTAEYIFVLKEKTHPLMDVSKYTLTMLNSDMRKLSKTIPLETIKKVADVMDKWMKGGMYSKKGNPFTYLRILLYRLGIELKAPKAAAFMSARLIALGYSGFSDRKGQGQIHPSEPIQAFFLSPTYYEVVERIDLKTLDYKDMDRREKSTYLQVNASKMSDDELVDFVKDDPELIKYAGPPRTEVLKKIVPTEGRKEVWKTKQYKPDDDYDGHEYVAAEPAFAGNQILGFYKKLPVDFIKWSIENKIAPIGWWVWWKKKNNVTIDTNILDELLMKDEQILDLYSKVDQRVAKLYFDKWDDVSALFSKMDDTTLAKFLSTVDYELPQFSRYKDVVAKDLYRRLTIKKNPSDEAITRLAKYIQGAGERNVPMDLVNTLKDKFPNFDFTQIGRWDYWKRAA